MSSCHYTFEGDESGETEVSSQTWENRYTHFGAENIQGDKMFVL
jgi:hypothetical protein